jgi:hypothetical protein
MKGKRKFLVFIAAICIALSLFCVTTFALSDEVSTEEITAGDVMTEEPGGTPLFIDSSIFDEIYAALLANADKILSAMAFCGTLIVGFAYKKGLLPLLGKAMSAIGKSVEGIKEDGIRSAQSTEARLSGIDTSIGEISEASAQAAISITKIEERLSRYDEAMAQYSAMKTVMSAQTDMLYSIFMSSALPQYQKEEVGERIAEMRKELKINEING